MRTGENVSYLWYLNVVLLVFEKSLKLTPAWHSDPLCEFTRSIDLDLDLSAAGLGVRSKRYALIVENGTVKHEFIAGVLFLLQTFFISKAFIANPGKSEGADAQTVLKAL